MDAIIYIRSQHTKIRKAFKAIGKTASLNSKKTKLNALCKELVKHETMEQKAWYPVLRKNKTLANVIKHLVAEEKSAAKTIKSFKKSHFDLIWKLKYMKFKRDVEHHARDEEKKLFPKVRKIIPKKELMLLGTKLQKFKAKLK